MSHTVTGLIAKLPVLEAFSRKHQLHLPVALRGGVVLLPLREVDLYPFQSRPSDGMTDGLEYLSAALVEELRCSSKSGPLMYFETEYFGGLGVQGAALFRDGQLAFGPYSAEVGPINRALQLLGIEVVPPAIDEFETVGLHAHRNTEAWLKLRRAG